MSPGTPRVAALSDLASLARLTGMTNNIQQGTSGVVIRFLLNAEEARVWNSRDWKAASVRAGLKHEARGLFRDAGRADRDLVCSGCETGTATSCGGRTLTRSVNRCGGRCDDVP